MRLIDADKLKVLVAVENDGAIRTGKLVTELFEDMETVDAIPVEWIEKWLEQYDEEELPRIYVEEFLMHDWRKENEQTER